MRATTPAPRTYRTVSVDDHVVEPPGVWQDRLPARLRERGPRVVPHRGCRRVADR